MGDGTPITILLSLLACVAVLLVRPGTALGLVIASSFIWPEFLRIPMGIAQMSVPRIAALVLFLRMFLSPGDHPPRMRVSDGLVLGLYVWYIIANIIAGTPDATFKTLVGSGFDTLLMYFVARRVFSDPTQATGVLKGLAITVLAMAPVALIENVTRFSPYLPFLADRQGTDNFQGGGSEIRFGMRRAFASTEQPIFFGMGILIVTGMIFSMRRCFETRWAYWTVIGAGFVCVFASLSSGPWAGLAVLVAINAFYFVPQLVKPAIAGLVAMMAAMEALSNRHFYHLIDYLALGGSNAYYRSRLMEVAVNNLGEYWAIGYGGRQIGHWGPSIDGRSIVDMVNNFIIAAVTGGLPAMLLYIGIKVAVIVGLVRSYRRGPEAMSPVCFGFAAGLIALSISELSVGLFGPPLLLSYILMGCAVSCSEWVDQLEEREFTRRARLVAKAAVRREVVTGEVVGGAS